MSDERDKKETEAVKRVREAAARLMEGTTTLAIEKGITPEELESVNQLAVAYYNSGNYANALELFKLLTVLDHFGEDYWMGLAATQQAMKDYAKAAETYGFLATVFDMHKVKYPFHAAQCFAALGDKENALGALQYVERFGNPQDAADRALQEKAAQLKARLGG